MKPVEYFSIIICLTNQYAPPEKVKARVAGLKQTAAQLGLPFGERTRTYNSRLSQELGLWAEDQGKGDEFHLAAFTGYFVNGENLADREVLLRLADSVGLSIVEAEQVISQRTYAAEVDSHWFEARQLGITAVPTFIAGLNRVVGAQPYEALAGLVQAAGAGAVDTS